MHHPGWILVILGLVVVGIGLLWLSGASLPWLGKLPGDLVVRGKNYRFYFPLATSVLLSVLLTAAVWLIRWLSK
jgi:uncharacterized membrane-anchored protein